ncbi:hypothetical protein [Gluconobacter oxydans]|nr:hypothetical protein [Gluconobacter oxydans]
MAQGIDAVTHSANFYAATCPPLPSWLAPAAILGVLGLIVSITNSARSYAKDRRDKILLPKISEFDTRISSPLRTAVQELEDVSVTFSNSFKQFRASTSLTQIKKRLRSAEQYQKESLDPAKFRLAGALQRSDAYLPPSSGKNWQDYEDELDALFTIMNEIQKEEKISIDRFDIIMKNFSSTVNNFSARINQQIIDTRRSIEGNYRTVFFGMFFTQKP